ncbi:hypothetical protein V6N13_101612 [Hibiscus sabdariffa]|uniref:Uncharacterized protein n=1 Tax=Hibiscus sabdariffa TaxID=183260 RepID=A0ABR2QLW2_9ROSI
MEIGFSDNSGVVRKATSGVKDGTEPVPTNQGSQSDSLSASSRSGPSKAARVSKIQEKDEALNACFIGREANIAGYSNAIESNRHLGESELKGGEHAFEELNNDEQSYGEGKKNCRT